MSFQKQKVRLVGQFIFEKSGFTTRATSQR